MKTVLFGLSLLLASSVIGQINSPRLSAASTIEQTVGLTEITLSYSRPNLRGRSAFGEVVPMDLVWRTGANENTTIEINDPLIFGNDTLKTGKYALYTKPSKDEWTLYFYATSDNWGTPDEWSTEEIVLEVKMETRKLERQMETFTISLDEVTTKDAVLSFSWDQTQAFVKFVVPTVDKMNSSIDRVMNGPDWGDYYNAADFYLTEMDNLGKALEWINKALELRGSERKFWIFYKKALIQEAMRDNVEALKSAQLALEDAKKHGNETYTKRSEALILELQ
ncbi:MAG: DUF2911 domain-containing protein [Crocinitomicaceae bacterium]|nr:DUF2911 domain-containing protein [Crocinitomicaceae bacterium]